jgi:hypothetical protein
MGKPVICDMPAFCRQPPLACGKKSVEKAGLTIGKDSFYQQKVARQHSLSIAWVNAVQKQGQAFQNFIVLVKN